MIIQSARINEIRIILFVIVIINIHNYKSTEFPIKYMPKLVLWLPTCTYLPKLMAFDYLMLGNSLPVIPHVYIYLSSAAVLVHIIDSLWACDIPLPLHNCNIITS